MTKPPMIKPDRIDPVALARRIFGAPSVVMGLAVLALTSASAPLPDTTAPGAGQAEPHDEGLMRLAAAWDGAGAPVSDAALPVSGVLAFAFSPATPEDRRRALRCLTQAVYYEAALEPNEGQEGVAQVVLNRVRDPNYPNTVCGVVYQGAERSTGCQFSFTCDGALSRPPVPWAWTRAEAVAERALSGHVATQVGTATHYHADYVSPWWAPTLSRIGQIGTHVFYRWRGLGGEAAALNRRHSGTEPFINEIAFARPRPGAEDALLAVDRIPLEDPLFAGRTVEIDGRTRTVGVASLGGRRLPTPEEIAEVNRTLDSYERGLPPSTSPAPPPGVTDMVVEEVGRPGPEGGV